LHATTLTKRSNTRIHSKLPQSDVLDDDLNDP
jgi:hypothetical protein